MRHEVTQVGCEQQPRRELRLLAGRVEAALLQRLTQLGHLELLDLGHLDPVACALAALIAAEVAT